MQLDAGACGNVRFAYYPSAHPDALKALKADLAKF